MIENNQKYFFGFFGFAGFLGMQAFSLHNPWYLFGFCLSAYFFYFKDAPGKWSNFKYLGLLSIVGLMAALLGVFKFFTV